MDYGNRPDGTKKQSGYKGVIKSLYGDDMTEFSIGVNIDGKEMDIPTIVPTLTEDELEALKAVPDVKDIPESIVQKAVEHAKKRLKEGKSPFKSDDEDERPKMILGN